MTTPLADPPLTAAYLRERAERCLRLAGIMTDARAAQVLRELAAEYEAEAAAMKAAAPSNLRSRPIS